MVLGSGLAVRMGYRVTGQAPALSGQLGGAVFLQNLPSLVVGHVLAPKPGDVVLDACAAPGGKTCHVASLMDGKGVLVACDMSAARSRIVRDNLDAFASNFANAFVCKLDAGISHDGVAAPPPHQQTTAELLRVLNAAPLIDGGVRRLQPGSLPLEAFDRILCDVPCSGLGIRPRLKHDVTVEGLEHVQAAQMRIVGACVPLLKPGGVLVYSTCSFNPMENEHMVRWMVDKQRLKLVAAAPKYGGDGLVGAGMLTQDESPLVQRFCPSDVERDTMGFFIAKFEKPPRHSS